MRTQREIIPTLALLVALVVNTLNATGANAERFEGKH